MGWLIRAGGWILRSIGAADALHTRQNAANLTRRRSSAHATAATPVQCDTPRFQPSTNSGCKPADLSLPVQRWTSAPTQSVEPTAKQENEHEHWNYYSGRDHFSDRTLWCVSICALLYTTTETCQPADAYTFFFSFQSF